MAIKITEECINCGACEPECPNNAIYEGGVEWAIADGTTIKGPFTLLDGSVTNADERHAAVDLHKNRLLAGQHDLFQALQFVRRVGCQRLESDSTSAGSPRRLEYESADIPERAD